MSCHIPQPSNRHTHTHNTKMASCANFSSTRRSNSDSCIKFIYVIISSLAVLGICAILVGIPVILISTGYRHLNNCPAEPLLPIHFILAAFVFCLNLPTLYKLCIYGTDHFRPSPAERVLCWFAFMWFVTGCALVYSIYRPDTKNATSDKFCNKYVYEGSVLLILAVWAALTMWIFTKIFREIFPRPNLTTNNNKEEEREKFPKLSKKYSHSQRKYEINTIYYGC